MSNGHARLSPSNHRWVHCPGSVREEAVYEDVPGEAAIDGTGSHLLLELCLRNGVRAEVYDGHIIGANHQDNPMGWLVSADRIARVQMCLDYVSRRVAELKAKFEGAEVTVESESRADPGGAFVRDDWYGTADISILVKLEGKAVFVEVCDYKDGRGWVDVNDNSQLVSYIFGKIRPWVASGPDFVRPFYAGKLRAVRMSVVQPKTSTPVRYTDMQTEAVFTRAEALAWAAARTDDPEAPLEPDAKDGKGHCLWCKHKGNCTALQNSILNKVAVMTSDIIVSDGPSMFELLSKSADSISTLTEKQLADIEDARPGVTAIFDKVQKEIQNRIENGIPVPGYAMKPGRGSNVWAEGDDVIAEMLKQRKLKKEQIYPPKLISPAQVLKLGCLTDAQKARIEREYITYKAGSDKLTKVGYEVTKPSVEDMFGAIPEVSFL